MKFSQKIGLEDPKLLKWLLWLLFIVFIYNMITTIGLNLDVVQIDTHKADIVMGLGRYKEESIGIEDIMEDNAKIIKNIQQTFGLDPLQSDNAADYLYVLELDDSYLLSPDWTSNKKDKLEEKLKMLERARVPFAVWMIFVHPFFVFFIPIWLALVSLGFRKPVKTGLLAMAVSLLAISGLLHLADTNSHDFESLDVRYLEYANEHYPKNVALFMLDSISLPNQNHFDII